MRLILATAGIALLASSGSAMAADCTKGLLWPYVRHPGDCLTDAEIQAGKTGVYSGPATGQVDVSTIKPPAQLNSASANLIECSHSWYWPFGGGDCRAAPAAAASSPAGSGATAGSSAAKDNPRITLPTADPATAAPAGKPQAAASPATPRVVESVQAQPAVKPQAAVAPPPAPIQVAQASTAECHKGILWPFVRDDGDCPTAAEAGKGKTSTVPTAASTPAAMPASVAPPPPPPAPPVQAAAVAGPSAAATCTKGTFWPFIRAAGDCPTAAERSDGSTPAVPTAASEPAAMPGSLPPPAQPAPVMQPVTAASPPVAASCSKGIFWPFIRESGDCATAAENSNGKTLTAPIAASEPSAMPVSIPPPAQPAPVVQPVAVASPPVAASCSKGIFWPFIRESGDCATAAENSNGKTLTAPIAASEPAAMPVSLPPPAPAMQPVAAASPPPAATCSRGTFWPFIREAGDCPTAAEKGSGKTSAVPIDASEPAANPVAVPAVATMPEQAVPARNSGQPANNPATCHKGLFWPFVRETGDCPTDAGKGPQRSPS